MAWTLSRAAGAQARAAWEPVGAAAGAGAEFVTEGAPGVAGARLVALSPAGTGVVGWPAVPAGLSSPHTQTHCRHAMWQNTKVLAQADALAPLALHPYLWAFLVG